MVQFSIAAEEEIRDIITKAVESKKTPGIVFSATCAERELCIIHAGSQKFGVPESGALNLDSTFWICSLTKLVVSIAALQLTETGKLDWDQPVADILPELANPVILGSETSSSPNGNISFRLASEQMKIGHLLNHTSGLFYPSDIGLIYTTQYRSENPIGQFFDLIKNGLPGVPIKHEPGRSFAYGISTDVLGFILEKITGISLEDYCRDNIFSPLGIKTSFCLTRDSMSSLVSAAFRQTNGEISSVFPGVGPSAVELDPENVNLFLGGTGLYSSMRDYLAILRHILQISNGTAINPILGASSVQMMFQPSLSPSGEKGLKHHLDTCHDVGDSWSVAMCINTNDVPGGRKKGSGWWYGHLGTYYFIDPESDIAAVLGSQIIPTLDPETLRLWDKCQRILYTIVGIAE